MIPAKRGSIFDRLMGSRKQSIVAKNINAIDNELGKSSEFDRRTASVAVESNKDRHD